MVLSSGGLEGDVLGLPHDFFPSGCGVWNDGLIHGIFCKVIEGRRNAEEHGEAKRPSHDKNGQAVRGVVHPCLPCP